MPDVLPEHAALDRRTRVLDRLRKAAPRGLRTGELAVSLGLGEHALYVALRELEALGHIVTNGRERSARRWLLGSSAPSPTPAADASTAEAGTDCPAGARGADFGPALPVVPRRPRSGVALRNAVAEALDLDAERCSDEDLVDDVREALADRQEAEAEAERLRAENEDLREALAIAHATLDGLGVPSMPWAGRASTGVAWRLGSLALRANT